MKKVVSGALAVALTVFVGGCGADVDGLTEEVVKIEEELADMMVGWKDVATVEANKARIEALAKRTVDLMKKNKDVKASQSAIDSAIKKYKPRGDAARKKQESAPPEVQAAVKRIVEETAAREMLK